MVDGRQQQTLGFEPQSAAVAQELGTVEEAEAMING